MTRKQRRGWRQLLFSLLPVAIAMALGGAYVVSEHQFEGQLVAIRSYNATWDDIRVGRYRTKPITLTGWLQFPAGRATGLPAAILVHGSDGLSEHQSVYAKLLVRAGFAVLIVDSFGSRGVKDTIGRQQLVSSYTMTVDAYRALAFLSRHPRIDRKRISIVGWSKGGTVAINTARTWFRRRLARRRDRFASHVAFYPWCGERQRRLALTGAPMLMLVAARDDWSGAAACVVLGRRARRARLPVETVIYDKASHGFDYDGAFRRFLPTARNMSNCVYLFSPHRLISIKTRRTYRWSRYEAYIKTCATLGAHVETNAEAREDSRRRLVEFLRRAADGRPKSTRTPRRSRRRGARRRSLPSRWPTRSPAWPGR